MLHTLILLSGFLDVGSGWRLLRLDETEDDREDEGSGEL